MIRDPGQLHCQGQEVWLSVCRKLAQQAGAPVVGQVPARLISLRTQSSHKNILELVISDAAEQPVERHINAARRRCGMQELFSDVKNAEHGMSY